MSLSHFLRQFAERNGYIFFRRFPQFIPDDLPDASSYRWPGATDYVRLYRPWTTPAYLEEMPPEVMANTMLAPMKLYILQEMMRSCAALPGDFFEAGVGSGGSSFLMASFIRQHALKKLVWMLDTYEGYAGIDAEKDSKIVTEGNIKTSQLEQVRALFKDFSEEARIVPGAIPGTLPQVTSTRFAFAHVDVNLYEPTYEATRFCLERMVPGGIIVFDDYNWPLTFGARRAIDDACAKYTSRPICIPESTQAFLIFRG